MVDKPRADQHADEIFLDQEHLVVGDGPNALHQHEFFQVVQEFFSFNSAIAFVPRLARYRKQLEPVLEFCSRLCSTVPADYSAMASLEFRRKFYRDLHDYFSGKVESTLANMERDFEPYTELLGEEFMCCWKDIALRSLFLAWILHRGQHRKGEYAYVPNVRQDPTRGFKRSESPRRYIDHPRRVMGEEGVAEVGPLNFLKIALDALHDTKEDLTKGFFFTDERLKEESEKKSDNLHVARVQPQDLAQLEALYLNYLPQLFPEFGDRLPHLLDLVSKDKSKWPSYQLLRARSSHAFLEPLIRTIANASSPEDFSDLLALLTKNSDRLQNGRSSDALMVDAKDQEMVDETLYLHVPLAALLHMARVMDRLLDFIFSRRKGITSDVREIHRVWRRARTRQELSLMGHFQSDLASPMKAEGFEPKTHYCLFPCPRALRNIPWIKNKPDDFTKSVLDGTAFSNITPRERELGNYIMVFPCSPDSSQWPRIADCARRALYQMFPADANDTFVDDRKTQWGRSFHFATDSAQDTYAHSSHKYGNVAFRVFNSPAEAFQTQYGDVHSLLLDLSDQPHVLGEKIQEIFKALQPELQRLDRLFRILDAFYIFQKNPSNQSVHEFVRDRVRDCMTDQSDESFTDECMKGLRSLEQLHLNPEGLDYYRSDHTSDLSSPLSLFRRFVRLLEQQVFTLFAEKVPVIVVLQKGAMRVSHKIFVPRGCNPVQALLYTDPFALFEPIRSSQLSRPFEGVLSVLHPTDALSKSRFILNEHDELCIEFDESPEGSPFVLTQFESYLTNAETGMEMMLERFRQDIHRSI